MHHAVLRQQCVDSICNNPILRSCFHTDADLVQYTSEMYNDGVFADELCIQSLCFVLKRPFVVFTPNYGIQNFASYSDNDRLPIRLTHNGVNHFDAVLYRHSPVVSNRQFFSFKAIERLANYRSACQTTGDTNPHVNESGSPSIPEVETSLESHQPYDTITLLSFNAASWASHSESLLACGADIIAVQEARVSSVGAIQQAKFLAAQTQPWHAVWGKPPTNPTKKFGMPARRAAGKTTYGGVGILSKQFLPLIPIGREGHAAQVLYESTRWTTVAIPLSTQGALARRFLHIRTFYGIVNRRNDAKHTQNERLLTQLFNYGASLGQQPVILCMDSNTTIQSSLTLNQALASKQWTDLGAFFTKNSPEFTFSSSPNWDKISSAKGVTRPDLILANPAALHMCQSFQLRRDLSVKGHLGLQIEISLSKAMEVISVFRPPKPFLQLPADKGKAAVKKKLQSSISQSFHKHFERYSTDFQKALDGADMDSAWTVAAKIGEAILADFSKQKGEGGRNCTPVFLKERAVVGAASKWQPDHVYKRALVSLHKLLRLLKELQVKQSLSDANKLSTSAYSEIDPLENICKICHQWHLPHSTAWTSINCQVLITQVENLVQQHQKSASICRTRFWKKKLRDSFEIHKHGADAFAWLNSKATVNLQAVSTPQGDLATNTTEMLQAIAHAWQALFYGLVTVPFWVYWTSPYSSHYRPYT